MREGHSIIEKFFIRRAKRLLPAYFSVVFVCLIAEIFIDSGGTLKGAAASFFYSANWAVGIFDMGMGSLGHTWTLSIEEQFYLIWPALLLFIVRLTNGNLVKIRQIILLLLIACYFQSLALLLIDISTNFVWNSTLSRSVELLSGAFLTTIIAPKEINIIDRISKKWATLITSILIVILVCIFTLKLTPATSIIFIWPIISFITCSIIYLAIRTNVWPLKLLTTKYLVIIGKVSYGIYLWHFPVFVIIDKLQGLDSWQPRFIAMGITAIIVPISYKLIEQPFRKYKH